MSEHASFLMFLGSDRPSTSSGEQKFWITSIFEFGVFPLVGDGAVLTGWQHVGLPIPATSGHLTIEIHSFQSFDDYTCQKVDWLMNTFVSQPHYENHEVGCETPAVENHWTVKQTQSSQWQQRQRNSSSFCREQF